MAYKFTEEDKRLLQGSFKAIGEHSCRFMEADGIPVILDSTIHTGDDDEENLEVHTLNDKLMAVVNGGKEVYLPDLIQDHDDVETLNDVILDYAR